MNVDVEMAPRRGVHDPQPRIPAVVAIHRGIWSHRKHGPVEKAVARGQPVQEITHHIFRRQPHHHMLSVVHPHLLAMVACAIDRQVLPIGGKLHRKHSVSPYLPKGIVETGNHLRRAHRLALCPLERPRQHESLRLLQDIVDIVTRSQRGRGPHIRIAVHAQRHRAPPHSHHQHHRHHQRQRFYSSHAVSPPSLLYKISVKHHYVYRQYLREAEGVGKTPWGGNQLPDVHWK